MDLTRWHGPRAPLVAAAVLFALLALGALGMFLYSFLAMTAYGLYLRRRNRALACCKAAEAKEPERAT